MKLDEKAIAENTGVAVKTLQNWRSRRMGPPYYKVGARVIYDESEVRDWLSSRRIVPPNHVPGVSRTP